MNGVFTILLQTWGCSFCTSPWLPVILSIVPPAIFCLICYYGSDNLKHGYVQLIHWFYVLAMLGVLVVEIVAIAEACGICNLVNQLFLFVVSLHFIAAILNLPEFFDLVCGIVYWAYMPTMLRVPSGFNSC